MGDLVLLVEPERATSGAIEAALVASGCVVVTAESSEAACRFPQAFDCGVFSDRLPDESGIGLAGWLLAEQRVRVAVFYGHADDIDLRVRASNLGTYVHRSASVETLSRAVIEAIAETRLARAVGAELAELRLEMKTGPRRKL